MNESLQVDTMPRLTLVLRNQKGAVVDISAASSLVVRLQPPTGDSLDKTLSNTTDGTDGSCYYDFEDGVLASTLVGQWRYQVFVTIASKKYKSRQSSFHVLRNLD